MTEIQNSKRLSPSQVKPGDLPRTALTALCPADLIGWKAVIQPQWKFWSLII